MRVDTADESYEIIEGNDAIKKDLEALYRKNFLLVHQTADDTAKRIMDKAKYFSGGAGITGTALFQEPETITKILPELDKPTSERIFGTTHKGSNAMIIMVFPRDMAAKSPDAQKFNTSILDDMLVDLCVEGKIGEIGLPNRFIYGYYSEGKLKKNPGFSPIF